MALPQYRMSMRHPPLLCLLALYFPTTLRGRTPFPQLGVASGLPAAATYQELADGLAILLVAARAPPLPNMMAGAMTNNTANLLSVMILLLSAFGMSSRSIALGCTWSRGRSAAGVPQGARGPQGARTGCDADLSGREAAGQRPRMVDATKRA